jgi:hypothetical protein
MAVWALAQLADAETWSVDRRLNASRETDPAVRAEWSAEGA